MAFTSKRGRPKIQREDKDCATKELTDKHQKGLTLEALDLVLYKGLISELEHKSGIHLRWLYSLRFGMFHLRAYNFDHKRSRHISNYDDEWLKNREEEYEQAVKLMCEAKTFNIVFDVCVFGYFPGFLHSHNSAATLKSLKSRSLAAMAELAQLREGLQILSALFGYTLDSLPRKKINA